MAEITGGELLLKALHAEGVRFVWAIPDGTYMIFLEALERLGGDYQIDLLVPCHEAAAAHAAEAHTRVTGEPAVVMACAGPGAANLLSGVMCAQDEGNPIIAITTTRRSDIAYPHMGAMQVVDQYAAFKSVVKWSAQVQQWKRIPEMVRHAFRVAMAGRPGPVNLEFPEDLLAMRGEEDSVYTWERDQYRVTSGLPADPAAVQRAAELLVNASLPLVHCGGGAHRSGAGAEVQALVEYLGCPLTTGPGARGIISEEHPQVTSPISPASAMVHSMADVVLAVGTRFGELDMWGRAPLWGDPTEQKILHLDTEARNIGLNRPVEVALVGDAAAVVRQLLAAIKALSPKRDLHEQIATIQSVDRGWREELDDPLADLERTPMIPGQIYTVCNDFFGEDAIIAMDGGNTCMWGANYHIARAQRSLLWTSHAGHLGTGLPYAIGAKLAAPDRPVYCITGDSAFRFNMQELETAARYQLPIICLVNVDGAWGMEKSAQRRVWGREAEWFGCNHAAVRYDHVAIAMGCRGAYVEKAADLPAVLAEAVASNQPTVIHCAVDSVANIDPPGLALWAAARTANF